MEKDKKILLSLVAIIVLLAGILGSLSYIKNKEEENRFSDSQKFKEEYEAWNGKTNENNGMNYPEVLVSESNPMKYMSDDEAVNFLKNGTGLIYFGYSTCPWCRTMVPLLLKAAQSTSLGNIYYVDIQDIRDQLSLDEENHIVVTNEGTNGYREILKALDSVLEPYYLTGKDGSEVDTLEKRLYAPTVVTVKNGEILDIHVDTVETQKSGYTPLTKEEEEELFGIYQEMILKLLDSTCDEAC